MRKPGKLRNDAVQIGDADYDVTVREDGSWSYGRLWTSDDNHRKLALAAEDLFREDKPIQVTGEAHDDGSLTFLPR